MAALQGRMVAALLSTTSAEHLLRTAEAVPCMGDLKAVWC
jgi:hypothetical protein